MRPNIDVKFTRSGPFPAAFLFLKNWIQQGKGWPSEIRKEQCLSLDCQSLEELKAEVERIKSELVGQI